MRSCARGLRPEGVPPSPPAAAGVAVATSLVQPHGPAADACRDRRLPRGSTRRTPTRGSSIACCLAGVRRAHGRRTGSTSRATPTRTATRPTSTRDMSPYRDWVISAFNRNLPYDQFLTWQLAGDLLPNATREQRIATAFNRLHRQTNEGGSIEEEFRTEYVADRVNTFGTALLGLTLECARCHDHKFDPITQRDYYSLFAFFNSIDESGLYSHFTNATPSPSLLLWPAHEQAARAVQRRIAAAEAELRQLARRGGPRPAEAFRAWRASQRRSQASAHADRAPGVRRGARAAQTPDSVAEVIGAGAGRAGGRAPTGCAGRRTPRSIQRRQRLSSIPASRPFSAPTPSRSPPAQADRGAGSRRRPASVARVDRCRQPRLRADAGSWPAVLRPDSLLAGQRHRRSRTTSAAAGHVVTPGGDLRRIEPRRRHQASISTACPLETDVVRDRLYKDISYRQGRATDRPTRTRSRLAHAFATAASRTGLIDDLQCSTSCLTAVEVPGAMRLIAAVQPSRARTSWRAASAVMLCGRRSKPCANRRTGSLREFPRSMVMEEMPAPRPAYLLARGAYDAPGDIVARETPAKPAAVPEGTAAQSPRPRAVAHRPPASAHGARGRQPDLAHALRPRHRRRRQEDFGSQGKLPTHPALLDWLAARFVDEGWDVKALHRLIVTSETFRQSSSAPRESMRARP